MGGFTLLDPTQALQQLPATQGFGGAFGRPRLLGAPAPINPSSALQSVPLRTPGPQLVPLPPPPSGPAPNLNPKPQLPDLPQAAAPDVKLPDWAPQNRLQSAEQKLSTLQQGPAVDHIQNPFLRTVGQIGDRALTRLTPGLASVLPGTTGNNLFQQAQHQQRIGQAQGDLTSAANLNMLNLQPQLKQMAAENTALKTQGYLQHVDDQGQHYQDQAGHWDDQDDAQLAQHGYKRDAQGKVSPMEYSEMSPTMQAATDLEGSRKELADAAKAYQDAKTKNLPMQMQMAAARIQTAQRNSGIALQRLQLSQQQFNAHAYNVGPDGNYLPGAPQLPDGTVVGTWNAKTATPTTTQRDAAGRAQTADVLRQKILQQIQDPEVRAAFGPVNGRLTEAKLKAGFASPKVAQAYNDLISYGAFQAGMHPVRGIGALQYFDKVNGGMSQTPEQLEGKLLSGQGVMQDVQGVGTPHVITGGSASRPLGHGLKPPPSQGSGGMISVQIPGMAPGSIPRSALQQFKRDHPNATVSQ